MPRKTLLYPLTEKGFDVLGSRESDRRPMPERFKHTYYLRRVKEYWKPETSTPKRIQAAVASKALEESMSTINREPGEWPSKSRSLLKSPEEHPEMAKEMGMHEVKSSARTM